MSFVFISRVTASTATSSIGFTNMPTTFRHFYITGVGQMNAQIEPLFNFNNETNTRFGGYGGRDSSEIATNTSSSRPYLPEPLENNNPFSFEMEIFDYTASTDTQSNMFFGSAAGQSRQFTGLIGFSTLSSADLTSFELEANTSNAFDAGTTLTLYGVE